MPTITDPSQILTLLMATECSEPAPCEFIARDDLGLLVELCRNPSGEFVDTTLVNTSALDNNPIQRIANGAGIENVLETSPLPTFASPDDADIVL